MKIAQGLKDMIAILKGIFTPKNDKILLVEDSRSLCDCVEEIIGKLDFEPKLKIKRIYGCPFLPWVIIEDGCYYINATRAINRFDIEVFGFQIAFKYVRMRAQKENPDMLLFTPEFSTGIPLIDQKISESYFDNFDNKKKTDGAISSWIVAILFIEDYCPVEEYSKLTRLGADKFIKFKVLRKERRIVIE